ncbi:hypothetical protein HDU81_010027 [Chytriomyces hyalinus]|nr:hypothetical protein HDU81_010027 [Chytriomyces hyalinus]
MGFENALKGVVLSINKFSMSKTPVPAIMIIANLLALVTGPVYILWMLTTTDCQSMTLAMKLCMHSFFTSFSFFLLYKTWIVSQKRKTVAIAAAILILNRCVWIVTDIAWSKTVQSPAGCFYIQDKVAIVGISTGGLLVDVFCTITTIMSAFRDVDFDAPNKMQRIYRVLIADNDAMCSSLALIPGTPSIMIVIPSISLFVYTQAINAEFAWMNVRNDIMKGPEREQIRLTSVSIGGGSDKKSTLGRVTIMSAFRDVDRDTPSNLQKVYQVLVADNVLRSVSIMAVNGFTLNYAVCYSLQVIPGTPSVMILIPAVSAFVYTQALNVEFFWVSVRNGIMRGAEGQGMRITSARLVDEKNGSRS